MNWICSSALWYFIVLCNWMFENVSFKNSQKKILLTIVSIVNFFLPRISDVKIQCVNFFCLSVSNWKWSKKWRCMMVIKGDGKRTQTPLIYSKQSVIQWHRHVLIMYATFWHVLWTSPSRHFTTCSSCRAFFCYAMPSAPLAVIITVWEVFTNDSAIIYISSQHLNRHLPTCRCYGRSNKNRQPHILTLTLTHT